MIVHLNSDEQNPAYDLLSNFYDYSNQMTNIINAKRINQITTFLQSLNIESKRFSEIIRTQNISVIQDFNEAFIHSSGDKIINYEKLEFFGDAVLRLAATNFIEKNYPQMSVGERSELRAEIVSDAWLWDLPNADDSLNPWINISQENLLGSPFFLETSIILYTGKLKPLL